MFASLSFGFFDTNSLRQQELVVQRALDPQQVHDLFRAAGEVHSDDSGVVDGHRFLIHPEGFVESTSVLASRKVIDFVSHLVQETGCQIASAQFGGVLTLESLVSNYQQLAAIFGSPGVPSAQQAPSSQVA